ncbi:hypothetical protein WJX84_003429 [Apatococcus fuscideae]|uniref:Uncharacterized protein n=1 Tax=Apatococcus fuscideae TaxID=2026836 RepID=A0AAW1T5Y4_9CHLO
MVRSLSSSRRSSLSVCLCLLIYAAQPCRAVREGDEVYSLEVSGSFYVFADAVIHIIDATSLTVVKNITRDQAGNTLTNALGAPRTWNDVVYIQDSGDGLAYIFANEGDIYGSGSSASSAYSYTTVIDVHTQQIVDRVQVQPRPVHIYAVTQTQQVWVHSDTTGYFDIIDVAAAGSLNSTVLDYARQAGHGKLLVDDSLFPSAYGTNVNEQFISEFDLEGATRTGVYNFSSFTGKACTGTHSLVYSNYSSHIFLECVDGGTLEWNALTNQPVYFHMNITGYISAAPADDRILVTASNYNWATVLTPLGNGVPAELAYTISIPGNPAQQPVYYSNSSNHTPSKLADYKLFWPLYRDTNKANIAAADVTVDGYLGTPTDCQYANPNVTSQSLAPSAYLAPSSSIPVLPSLTQDSLLLLNNSNGSPKTPSCGACAAGVNPFIPNLWNGSLSGLGITNFTAVETAAMKGTDALAYLLPAGANKLLSDNSTTANQCAYSAEANRAAMRGGQYVAITADIPQPSIYVVDASRNPPQATGFVATASNPKKLQWVPSQKGQ